MTKKEIDERRIALNQERDQLLLRLGRVDGALSALTELEPYLLAAEHAAGQMKNPEAEVSETVNT